MWILTYITQCAAEVASAAPEERQRHKDGRATFVVGHCDFRFVENFVVGNCDRPVWTIKKLKKKLDLCAFASCWFWKRGGKCTYAASHPVWHGTLLGWLSRSSNGGLQTQGRTTSGSRAEALGKDPESARECRWSHSRPWAQQ